MAKKKIETPADIMSAYMKYVLEHGEQPKSSYLFAQHLVIKEVLKVNITKK